MIFELQSRLFRDFSQLFVFFLLDHAIPDSGDKGRLQEVNSDQAPACEDKTYFKETKQSLLTWNLKALVNFQALAHHTQKRRLARKPKTFFPSYRSS